MGVLSRAGLPRRHGVRLGAWVGLLVFLASTAAAQPEADLASRVQAAYVYKFLGFVRWPADAPLADGAVRVGFAAGDTLATALEALGQRRAGSLPIQVQRVVDPASVAACRVLVVGDPAEPKNAELLARARGRPVLTVAASADFPPGAGIVRFVIVDDRVRFEVDLAAAELAGLEIDSRLLGVATVVHRAPSRGP